MPQDPIASYFIRWVQGQASLRLYDAVADVLEATEYAGPTRGEIIVTSNLWTFNLAGVAAMTVSDAGVVTVPAVSWKAAPAADQPRMEFVRVINSVPTPVGYIADGKLWVPQAHNGALPTSDRLLLGWAAVNEGGIFAAEYINDTP